MKYPYKKHINISVLIVSQYISSETSYNIFLLKNKKHIKISLFIQINPFHFPQTPLTWRQFIHMRYVYAPKYK